MNEVTLSTRFLKEFFDIRKQYLETILLFITCILKGQTTNIKKLSTHVNTKIQIDSVYTRLLNLLKKTKLSQLSAAKLILLILKIDTNQKQIIAIDRTYWMFGRIHLNFLYLSILKNGYAIPLFFVICGPNKKGHSSIEERTKLFDYFDEIFAFSNIEYVLADREFFGGPWLKYLQSKGINFVQRCKEKKLYVSNSRGVMVLAANFYRDLKMGEKVYLGLRKISKSNTFSAHLTIIRAPDNEIIALAHSSGVEEPCKAYRLRWKIELCFRSLKSHGFNIEDASITMPSRIENLLILVNIAFAFALNIGEAIAELKPIKIKKHGRKAISFVRLALYYVSCYFSRIFQSLFYSGRQIAAFAKNLIKPRWK